MRFRIEQTFLTNEEGAVIPPVGHEVRLHIREAATVEEALESFVHADHGQIVGNVIRFPGFQLIATARRDKSVYTLHLDPATDMTDMVR